MKARLIFVLLGVLSLSFGAVFAVGSHEPIVILGNGDFTAENGVIAGSGTADDPYIIAGWEIKVPQGEPYGVKIENATAYFVLRGLIVRDALAGDGAAFRLGFVSSAVVERCTVMNVVNGIEIASSSDLVLRENVLWVLGKGLLITGESAEEYRHDIDESNLLNDYPIHYLYGRDGETVSGLRSSNLYVSGSRNMTITENEIVDGDGIQLAFVEDSRLSDNQVYRSKPVSTEHGIKLYRSDHNMIENNTVKNNRLAGVYLWFSADNQILNNQILSNDTGIRLAASDRNIVCGNTVVANPTGISLLAGSTENEIRRNLIYYELTTQGIALIQAVGNRLEENVIYDCETGILFETQANGNTVVSNSIISGAYGMFVVGSYNEIANNFVAKTSDGVLFQPTFGQVVIRGNTFHDNVFFANRHRHVSLNEDSEGNRFYRNYFLDLAITNAWIYDPSHNNIWVVAEEGNFWGDYAGGDVDGDGIGDEPVLVLPAGVEDTAPITSFEGAIDGLGVLSTLERRTLTLRLGDDREITVDALVADAAHSRFLGFRGFPEALLDGYPGIFFAYDQEIEGGATGVAFVMQTVDFPLDIVVFNGTGEYVGSWTMEPDFEDRYTVSAAFQYALELPEGTLAELGIDEETRLILSSTGE